MTRESLVLEINSSVEKDVLNVNPKQTSRNLSDSGKQSYNLNVQKNLEIPHPFPFRVKMSWQVSIPRRGL